VAGVNQTSSTRITVTELRRFSICIQDAPFDGNGSAQVDRWYFRSFCWSSVYNTRRTWLVHCVQLHRPYDANPPTYHLFAVTGTTLNWIRSYLEYRSTFGRWKQASSSVQPLETGVPQGSTLRPLLFCLYIAPLSRVIRAHGINYHQYANYKQVYVAVSKSDFQFKLTQFETCMASVHTPGFKWMGCNQTKTSLKLSSSRLTVDVIEWRTSGLKYCHQAFTDHKESRPDTQHETLVWRACDKRDWAIATIEHWVMFVHHCLRILLERLQVNSRTNQIADNRIADWSTRGLDNLYTM